MKRLIEIFDWLFQYDASSWYLMWHPLKPYAKRKPKIAGVVVDGKFIRDGVAEVE